MWFQKISHPKEGLLEIPERRGGGRVVSIGKISYKEMYEPKLEFLKGWGFIQLQLLSEGYGYFLE